MTLLNWGKFKSHSGIELDYKIDCDALTDEDIECCAAIIAKSHTFDDVHAVETGGIRLAKALVKYCMPCQVKTLLIVDDVLTTGKSVSEAKERYKDNYTDIHIAVIFARQNTINKDLGQIFTIFGAD